MKLTIDMDDNFNVNVASDGEMAVGDALLMLKFAELYLIAAARTNQQASNQDNEQLDLEINPNRQLPKRDT
jgi:hypothetical protein